VKGKLRSAGALLAGFLLIVVLSTAVDIALHAAGVYPPLGQPMSDPLALLALSYRIAISIGGCYLTARLAPGRPMTHSLALGVLGVAVSTIGTVVTWGRPEFGPVWYPLSLIAVSLPCGWMGGWLAGRGAQPAPV
jgi:hypothetical protein